jgi:hypothetical protein
MKFLKKYKKKLASDLSKLELKTAYPLNLFTGELLYTHVVEFYGDDPIEVIYLSSGGFFLHLKKHLNSYMDHNLNRFPYYSEGQYYLTIYFKPSQLSDVNFYVHKLKNKTQTK